MQLLKVTAQSLPKAQGTAQQFTWKFHCPPASAGRYYLLDSGDGQLLTSALAALRTGRCGPWEWVDLVAAADDGKLWRLVRLQARSIVLEEQTPRPDIPPLAFLYALGLGRSPLTTAPGDPDFWWLEAQLVPHPDGSLWLSQECAPTLDWLQKMQARQSHVLAHSFDPQELISLRTRHKHVHDQLERLRTHTAPTPEHPSNLDDQCRVIEDINALLQGPLPSPSELQRLRSDASHLDQILAELKPLPEPPTEALWQQALLLAGAQAGLSEHETILAHGKARWQAALASLLAQQNPPLPVWQRLRPQRAQKAVSAQIEGLRAAVETLFDNSQKQLQAQILPLTEDSPAVCAALGLSDLTISNVLKALLTHLQRSTSQIQRTEIATALKRAHEQMGTLKKLVQRWHMLNNSEVPPNIADTSALLQAAQRIVRYRDERFKRQAAAKTHQQNHARLSGAIRDLLQQKDDLFAAWQLELDKHDLPKRPPSDASWDSLCSEALMATHLRTLQGAWIKGHLQPITLQENAPWHIWQLDGLDGWGIENNQSLLAILQKVHPVTLILQLSRTQQAHLAGLSLGQVLASTDSPTPAPQWSGASARSPKNREANRLVSDRAQAALSTLATRR